MPYAKFERTQPREWRRIPFAYDDAESIPALPEVVLWIVLGAMFLFMCLMLMGVA